MRWPNDRIRASERVLGDVELMLDGAYGNQRAFGGVVPYDPAIEAALRSGTGAVLVDHEGAPVATVSPSGEVTPTAEWAARPSRSLRIHPGDVAAVGPHRAVLLRRPLLASEVSALADISAHEPVLLLVRTVDPLIPAHVLASATRAAAARMPGARVVAIPFGLRDTPEADQALSQTVLASHGAITADVLESDDQWRLVSVALDTDDEGTLVERLDPDTLAVLRRWRPPRDRRGLVVFFTGLSGSGKSTIARGLVDRLNQVARTVTLLDGDVARRMLSSGLGFSRDDRDTNIRRMGWVGAEVARHGGVGVLAPIAPFAQTRAEVRRMVEATGDLVLVWVSTPLEECERRDRKGLYAQARRGEVADFTGISSPYEEPDDADLVVDTTQISVDEAVEQAWRYLVDGGWVSPDPVGAASAAG